MATCSKCGRPTIQEEPPHICAECLQHFAQQLPVCLRWLRIQQIVLYGSLAGVVIGAWLLDSTLIGLTFGGVAAAALVANIILDFWYWKLTDHLITSAYIKLGRLIRKSLWIGIAGMVLSLVIAGGGDDLSPFLFIPAFLLFLIGILLSFVQLVWYAVTGGEPS